MTSNIQRKRLGDLFAFRNGRAFKKEEWVTKGLPIIRIQNLNRNEAGFNYFDGEYSKDILVEAGDLLFSWSGTVGSSFGSHLWNGETGLLNQHIFKIGLNDSIIKRYAFYALRYITEEIEASVSGAVGLVHITKEKLNEFTIPVPPLAEQQRIVGILDEAFEGIARAKAIAEKNLQNARALFESHLQSVFTQRGDGWVEKRLGELCDILDNQRKPITKRDRIAGDIPYYGATCIQDYVKGFIFDEPLVLVGEDGAKWKSGDKTAFAVSGKCWVNNHAHVLRPHRDKITDYWLISFLTHSDLTPFVSGLTIPKLNQGNLREIPIPLPPILSQRQLAETAESLDKETQHLASLYTRKLAALEGLKKSLLHQAFSGEL